jgi:hypothetical protein
MTRQISPQAQAAKALRTAAAALGHVAASERAKVRADATEEGRKAALAAHLGEPVDDIEAVSYDDKMFEAGGGEYLVLTDAEADERVKDSIKDSVWAFRPSFLAEFLDMPEAEEMFAGFQEAKSEGANSAFVKMIGNRMDEFVQDAVSADGRGHFLSGYDGDEAQEGEFFIYRTN